MENQKYDIRPDVLTYDDVRKMLPALDGHPRIVNTVLHWLKIDEVNRVHGRWCSTPGIPFTHALIEKDFKIKLRIDNEEILDRFPDTPFITVSNHPFGALDGITLLHLVGNHRPDFKVMVNMFLNHLSAMRPCFLAVDPSASNDPKKKAQSMQGIREAMRQVKNGSPIGFFPSGAVSNFNRHLRIRDRQWQPSIIRLIQQMKVPVIPIFFHGKNSFIFNLLGLISWQLRVLRFPAEIFRRRGKELHISIGEPIMPEDIAKFDSVEKLGEFLRTTTYSLSGKQV